MKANFKIPQQNIKATFVPSKNSYTASFSIGGREATNDYLLLYNKPLINGIELIEDKTSLELGLASSEQGLLADSALQPNDNISELVNNVGYITGITSSDIQTALGYIPYSAENPSGFITISALNGYATEQWVNNQGFIKGISNTDVINALGYTPYDNSNPAGYITSASLPTVNNSTITIQKNGLDIESFNLNQSTNKTINITVPTQTSDLINNSGFITNTVNNLTNYYLKSETYTKLEVQQLIASIPQFSVEVVQSLPATGERMVLYLVPKDGEAPDVYNEYIWVETDEDFELIGNTEIDLTDYATKVYVDTGLALKANDNAVVHLLGNETIDGKKTFNDATYFKGVIASISSTSDPTSLNFRGGTNGITFSIGAGEKVKLTNQLLNVTTPINATTPSQSETENKRVTTIGYINSKLADYVETSDLSTVATTGDYDDLSNKPTIPTTTSELTNDSGYITSTALTPYALISSLSAVATSGSYTDLSDKPTIGNGTITFTQGGVTKGTITTNQSGNTTIDFDAGGGGAVDSVNGQTGTVILTASDVGALADTTTIPSKTSDLTNDSGFITGITSSDVTTALGYTPYNSTNPSGYITSSALNGYATETWVGNQGYLTGITSSDVITALTYTPYNGATNPNGYITSSALSDYVDLASAQDISGRKTFLGEKAIYFKQLATANKLGFTLYNPSNVELGALEYRPNTINGASLLALNCPQTTGGYVGFRYWGTPAVNIVAPKVATAGNYFIPTHITDGNTTVTAGNTGTVNISTLLPDVSNFVTNSSLATTLEDYAETSDIPTAISDLIDDTSTTPIDKAESIADQRDSSSLKYWTGTKAQYDAIVTKDNNTIYNVEDTTSPIVDILNTLYPIGAIYIGTMATCPLSVLGIGTWQLVAQDRVLQGAGTRGTVGTTINESLPNITGLYGRLYSNNDAYSGVFSSSSHSTLTISYLGSGSGMGWNNISFNANNSSSTYQDNAPVQQDGYLVNIWERIS